MKRKIGIILGGFLMLLTNISCASTRCAGCMLNEAYSDPQALALVKAAVHGDAKEVEQLVAAGANPNHLEEGKVPMLLWTLCAENVRGFEALLKAGADPNLGGTGEGHGNGKRSPGGYSTIEKGWSATVMAASIDRPEFLRLALKYGGDKNARKGEGGSDRPLLQAALHALFENVKILVEAGADINVHDERYSGNTAAEESLNLGRFDIAIWLLEHGYTYDLQGLAEAAEGNYVHEGLQPYKEKLIDMLRERGMVFPASGLVQEGLKTRQIPPEDVQDLIYGRRSVWDYPKKPGMEEDYKWP